MLRVRFPLLIVIAVLLTLTTFIFNPAHLASADSSKTAQGIDVALTGLNSTFTVTENKIYKFNQATAESYFSNTVSSALPTVSCNGSAANCAVSNQPATPSAPAPNPDVVSNNGHGLASTQQCTFLNGGTLSGTSYQQGVTVNGKNGKGLWTFTYSYNASPNTNPVAPFTAWDLFKDTVDGTLHTDIAGFIAGESVVQSSKFPNGKYSFSLDAIDPITGLTVSRVTDLALYVDGTFVTSLDSVLEFATPGNPSALDFNYVSNAGTYGFTSLLKNGDALTILNTDDLLGNNNGGATGRDLARAVLQSVGVDLTLGNHTLTIAGTVKGNGIDLPPIPFSVTGSVHIITPGCNGNGQ